MATIASKNTGHCIDNNNMKGVDFMATSNINIRVASKIKEEAEKLFNNLGLNMTTAHLGMAVSLLNSALMWKTIAI